MFKNLVKKILIYEGFDNLLLEDVEQVKKIKEKNYPNLKLDDSHLQTIHDLLVQQQILKSSFINWIFLLIKNRVPRVLEDLDTIVKNLKVFNNNSSKIAADGHPTMLYKQNGELVYKNPQQLYDIASKYGKVKTGEEYKLIEKGNYLESKGLATKIYEDTNVVVFRPDTYEASQELACLSQWCTRFPDMYKHYSKQGPLYIILDKNKLDTEDRTRMIQFHIPSKQFKDALDREVPNRREYMNGLKGLFNTMFPSSIKEFQLISSGKRKKEDLTQSSRDSRFIMPQEFWDQFDIPCDEMQEIIARQLGIDCKNVEEGDYGYIINDDENWRVGTVREETEQAIDYMLGSGLDDEYFINYILPSYEWNDVFYPSGFSESMIEEEFGDDWENVYEYFKNDLKNEYSEEEIQDGKFISDIDYDMFINALISKNGDDPVKYYINELGYKLRDIGFIDLEEAVSNYFENCYGHDCLCEWIASYDGNCYYFKIHGEEHVLYRTE